MSVWQTQSVAQGVGKGLKQMRGSRVMWSPDSPADEEMKTQPNAENPEARFTTNYS